MPKAGSSSSGDGKKSDKTKRPPNSFMLYRVAKLKVIQAAYGKERGPQMSEASKVIGEWWENEKPEIRDWWQRESLRVAEEHKRLHPEYAYKPRTQEELTQEKEEKRLARKAARKEKAAAKKAAKQRVASSMASGSTSRASPDSDTPVAMSSVPSAGPGLGPSFGAPFGDPMAALSLPGRSAQISQAGPSSLPAPAYHGHLFPSLPVAAFPQSHHFPGYLPTPVLDAQFGVSNGAVHPPMPQLVVEQPWNHVHRATQQFGAFPEVTPQTTSYQQPLTFGAMDTSHGQFPFVPEGPLALPDMPLDWTLPPLGGVEGPVSDAAAPEIAAPLPRLPAAGYHFTFPQPEEHAPTPEFSASASASSSLSSPFDENILGTAWGTPEENDFSSFDPASSFDPTSSLDPASGFSLTPSNHATEEENDFLSFDTTSSLDPLAAASFDPILSFDPAASFDPTPSFDLPSPFGSKEENDFLSFDPTPSLDPTM